MPTERAPRRIVGVVFLAGGSAAAAWAAVAGGDALGPVIAAAAGGVALGLGAALVTRRPEARPAPAADQLPAAVAHRMSSPLSSLKTNLEWLRDALEAGRLREPRDQAEAREVLDDAREAAEALRADVGQLRADVGQLRAAAKPPGDPPRR